MVGKPQLSKFDFLDRKSSVPPTTPKSGRKQHASAWESEMKPTMTLSTSFIKQARRSINIRWRRMPVIQPSSDICTGTGKTSWYNTDSTKYFLDTNYTYTSEVSDLRGRIPRGYMVVVSQS